MKSSHFTITCAVCGAGFQVSPYFASGPRMRKYCSRKCSSTASIRETEHTCQQCGIIFQQKSFARNPGLFCSPTCLHEHRRQALPVEDIIRLYQSGLTIYEIGKRFSVSGATIQYRLKTNGVARRDASTRFMGANNPMSGRTHTTESRQKIRAANAKQFSQPAARQRHAELTAQQIADGRTGKTNNSLEKRCAAILDQAKVTYKQGFRVGRFAFDFYLPDSNILVECDGTFWHADPRRYPDRDCLSRVQQHNVENDRRKNALAAEEGFILCRLWEQDIIQNPAAVLETLCHQIALSTSE